MELLARFPLFFVWSLLALVDFAFASWWNLGMPQIISGNGVALDGSPASYKENCDRLDFLADKQKKQICGMSEKVMASLSHGARIGIEECQHQFRHSRWNCSTVENSTDIFGGVMSVNSREASYIYAVSSASVAWAITRSCAKGELNDCSCDNRVRKKTPKNWQWGGCSEDIHYGEKFSREFIDAREDRVDSVGLMNLHNNEAGRRAIRSRMQRVCKCHGMSGSCSVRVCWRKLPNFRIVGEALTARYDGASHVKVVDRKRGKKMKKLRPYHPDMKKPNKTDLVYLDDSPDYCESNEAMDILGTHGRLCNRTSAGSDGCRLLCCGRGYQTRVFDTDEKCQCRFVWCCNVVCETCHYKKEEHICN
ncbi:protein Wnt-4-like [Arctopsyche grandis]|uniref:protein Wnt-4-like n=1 Tax=Arctopsyche grandis TaxID=121162 RepID=UPI00406D7BD1